MPDVLPAPDLIRLPRTATRRGAVSYLKLISKIRRQVSDGFGFEGTFLRSGSEVSAATLWPQGPEHIPILLERTEIGESNAERKKHRWESLYILWRFDVAEVKWVEIARAQGDSHDAIEILRSAAVFALGKASWGVAPVVVDVAERIRSTLQAELEPLEPMQRSRVLAIVHDELAGMIVEGRQVA